jgi:hypothetical protein
MAHHLSPLSEASAVQTKAGRPFEGVALDVSSAEKDAPVDGPGVVVDAHREIRGKLYMGKVSSPPSSTRASSSRQC